MDYKPNQILDNMTREEALNCVIKSMSKSSTYFVYNKTLYSWVANINLPGSYGENFELAINDFYDAKDEFERRPKWVEPTLSCASEQHLARDRVTSFINANGGKGKWMFHPWENGIDIWHHDALSSPAMTIGTITCVSRELAVEVISRFPDELNLLI